MKYNQQNVRELFLKFFEQKGHMIRPSAPLVNSADPRLLFINSGMNPFKDYFVGNDKSPWPRVVNSQRCLRVSGKHNDLEEVGTDTYHLTCFEMLGSWSFGDYFKKEAIEWAWLFLSKDLSLPSSRLYATVFEGTKDIPMDKESKSLWRNYLPADHILSFGMKDNFWSMGAVGPCGPCSELHIDLRSDADRGAVSGADLVNKGHPQVIELWNLVFMQYNRRAEGSLSSLPQQHVDTGMGFERLCMVLQGKDSVYETDVFMPLVRAVCARAGCQWHQDEKTDVAIRVIADHLRSVAFAMADGCLPSATQQGYVIRRLLRRALRYGHTFLSLKEPFLSELLDVVVQTHGTHFKELADQASYIGKLIKQEEESFMQTLERGLKLLSTALNTSATQAPLAADVVFQLYDTYGFPVDLTSLIAAEQGKDIDMIGFQRALEEQRTRSKKASQQEMGDWVEEY